MPQTLGVNSTSLTPNTVLGDHPPVTKAVTIATTGAEATYKRGTVMGKISASGLYAGLDPDASDGSETATVVLLDDVTVDDTNDEPAVALVHGDVIKDDLVWTHDGITEAEQDAALGQLETAGIYNK